MKAFMRGFVAGWAMFAIPLVALWLWIKGDRHPWRTAREMISGAQLQWSYQLVWWGWGISFSGVDENGSRVRGLLWTPDWLQWGFFRPSSQYTAWRKVYAWRFFLGPLEIRRKV
jgi:hypothetical protein